MKVKKILSLASLLVVFSCVPAYAVVLPNVERTSDHMKKIEILKEKQLIVGYENGELGLDRQITRSEIAKLFVHALGEEKIAQELKGKEAPFSDVPKTHWANGYIAYGKENANPFNHIPLIAGYPDGKFQPEQPITNGELVKMMVVLAKRNLTKEQVQKASWPQTWIQWARENHIIGSEAGLEISDFNQPAVRREAFIALYQAILQLQGEEKTEEVKKVSHLTREKARPRNFFGWTWSRSDDENSNLGDGRKPEIKPQPQPAPTPQPNPQPTTPTKDPDQALKEEVKQFLSSIDLEKIKAVADEKGKEIYNIPVKEVALQNLQNKMQRARQLVEKKTLTPEELKELEDMKPQAHPKTDNLAKAIKNFVVQWEVQGERKVSNQGGSNHYTELIGNEIRVKSPVVKLKDEDYKIELNYVTKENYEVGGSIDTVSGATPKYKKNKLDPKYYSVEKTEDRFVIQLKTTEPGYEELIQQIQILKPVIKVHVADQAKIENGDLVFLKKSNSHF